MELKPFHHSPSPLLSSSNSLLLLSSLHVRLPPPNPTATTPTLRLVPTARGGVKEIRVCVNRTCGKQGARETLSVLSDIAPPEVSVVSCGCLGRCGAGPNLVVLPSELMVGHCGTAARAAEALAELFGGGEGGEGFEFDPWRNLEALALRKKGEAELVEKGDPSRAVDLLSQAVALKPSGGLHVVYKSRSAARLAMGDTTGALEDAKEASKIAPEFPQAYICEADVYMAMEEWDAAEKAYSTALQLNPSIRRSKSFKARVAKLQQIFDATNGSS